MQKVLFLPCKSKNIMYSLSKTGYSIGLGENSEQGGQNGCKEESKEKSYKEKSS